MKQIQKGTKPTVNLGSETDDDQGGFKVTLQKPSKSAHTVIKFRGSGVSVVDAF